MRGCRPLSDDEADLLQRSFGGRYGARDRALFLLGVKSGFRIAELLSLRVGEVYQHGRIVDRVTVPQRHMKKKLEGRSVLLHPEAKTALAAWLMELRATTGLPTDRYVFHSRKGGNRPIGKRQAWKILHEAVTTNELTGKVSTHSMRKTFANRVYQQLNRDLLRNSISFYHQAYCTAVWRSRQNAARPGPPEYQQHRQLSLVRPGGDRRRDSGQLGDARGCRSSARLAPAVMHAFSTT